MAKFLNKKEQVIDFQFTPYGKRKLAIGNLKPTYYSFYDEGIIYDGEYASLREEKQNEIHERIKKNTQYLEGILSFQGIENTVPYSDYLLGWSDRTHDGIVDAMGSIFPTVEIFEEFVESYSPGGAGFEATDYSAAREYFGSETPYWILALIVGGVSPAAFTHAFTAISPEVSVDKLSFQSEIGDAYFDGEDQQAAPAWKIVACQGTIKDCSTMDDTTYYPDNGPDGNTDIEYKIPQLNVNLFYKKRIGPPSQTFADSSIANTIRSTRPFSDGNVVELIKDDLVVYAEEMNTLLLTDNFDVEVFEMKDEDPDEFGSDSTSTILERKYYQREDPQVVDGHMIRPRPQREMTENTTALTKDGVEYYFDVLTDHHVDSIIACKCQETFNKETYYIDMDFDCPEAAPALYYDIYGSVTVPEICAVPNEGFAPSGSPTDPEPCEDE
tara:strand:- start:3640 stop:4962 length:1323 start_codon:yes stop_codon:yes gene_type:complete